MGRLNEVMLFGTVPRLPMIKKNDETGELENGIGVLNVLRTSNRVKNGRDYIGLSSPYITTRDPAHIAQMTRWQENDIVLTKGFFSTRVASKVSTCPFCGAKNKKKGVLNFVEPIYTHTVQQTRSSVEAHTTLLNEYREMSNTFRGVGTLMEDPSRMVFRTTDRSGFAFLQYRIAISRNYRVRNDPAEKTVDFPWVKVYGEACNRDYYRLKKGSQVYIDGYLQTRRVTKHMRCAACGMTYDWTEATMEVVPYHTEYLSGFRTEEEVQALQEERNEQVFLNSLMRIYSGAGMGSEIIDEDDEPKGELDTL